MPDQPQPIATIGGTQVLFAPDGSGVQLVTTIALGIAIVQSWPREQLVGMLQELTRRQLGVSPDEMNNLLRMKDLHA